VNYQPEANRLLYADLLTQCARGGAPPSRGISFVPKTVKGTKHWYLQLVVGSHKTQHYLGPDSEDLRDRIARERRLWKEGAPDRRAREALVAMLIAGGAASVGRDEARLFELLERVGVFLVGGAVVGSHAFGIYANMLGVSWSSESTRTADVDVAADPNLLIGVTDAPVDLRAALLDSGMGFFEVPALNRKHPSTSYAIRGRQLRVDLLTPMCGKTTSVPVVIRALGVPAEPVRFLDYLLEATEPAVVVARAGVLVNVPTPARYALHKLVTLQRRPAAFQTKALKDFAQARQLLEVLSGDRPGDVALAWAAAHRQQAKFRMQLEKSLQRLPPAERERIALAAGAQGKR
jgi:hypothetical protein